MSSEKTEEPTPKKIKKAREEGQVAHSKDFTQTVLILALFGYMLADARDVSKLMGDMMVYPAGLLQLNFEDAVNTVMTQLLRDSIRILLPYLLIVIGLGMFVEMLQTNLLIAVKSIIPSGKKLNIVNNIKNIFAKKNLMEFLKSNVKIVFLSAIIYVILQHEIPTLMTLPQADLVGVGVAVGLLLKTMIARISVGYAIIAAFDFVWQRHNYRQEQKMTKDEVKREYKEAEGDHQIKHERKNIHKEMLEEGPVEKSRKASVVVTNPTHLAMAIQYKTDVTPLPWLMAKGEGALAERMVVAAREAGVPVLQNIPLAWALKEHGQVGRYIPDELIEPVAEVLRMVREMRLDGES